MTEYRNRSLREMADRKNREGRVHDDALHQTLRDAEQRMQQYRGMDADGLMRELMRMREDPEIRSSIASGRMQAALERLAPALDDGQRRRLQDILQQIRLE